MIEVVIDSIRVSLMSPHRVVILKDINSEHYLPIWIGTSEADAITMELQQVTPPRPLTHDLLKSVIQELGGKVVHVLISALRKDVFYARLVIEVNGRQIEIDSRSSDAIALAVRVNAPIFVDEMVMKQAGITPDESIENEPVSEHPAKAANEDESVEEEIDNDRLSAFADFVNTLNLDDLDDNQE